MWQYLLSLPTDQQVIIASLSGVITAHVLSPLVLRVFNLREVVRVVDGDTVDVRGYLLERVVYKSPVIRLRLNRIDAPDVEPGKTKAAQFLRTRIGSVVRVEALTKEKYGRTLAEIYTLRGCVNDAMVRAGHATYYDGGKK